MSENPFFAKANELASVRPMPTRRRMSNTLVPVMFGFVEEQKRKDLERVHFVSFTMDGSDQVRVNSAISLSLIHSCAFIQFVVVTAHYLLDFKLHSMCLDMIEVC